MTAQRGTPTEFLGQPPAFRRLRVFAVNPSLGVGLDVALRNQTTLQVPWEDLEPGPVGEYLEVVDHDPPSRCFYSPVDLNHPSILVQDGLTPSEASPQFHQQMVYAVAMVTIRNFEAALGRRVLWAPRTGEQIAGQVGRDDREYVARLRIYPHALREANSYYSPQKKALLFGYFPAPHDSPGAMPGGMVFTCLSPEIVAQETAHALIDGARPHHFHEPTNPDVLAFYAAFADVVALFQSFTQPEWIGKQIARGRGDLAGLDLLGQLAQQSGASVTKYGALRDAFGSVDPITGTWSPLPPDPSAYETALAPLERGAILVAAIFDAYLAMYRNRVADLLEIATRGTGILPTGALPQALVRQMAAEAARAARHVLRMCIRAIDYCPPMDLTFGEFLRALITADSDLVPDDDLGYRPALVEAFRQRGIYPRQVRTLSVESLRWHDASVDGDEIVGLLQRLRIGPRQDDSREGIARRLAENRRVVHEWLMHLNPKSGIRPESGLDKGLPIAVHSVHPAWRVGPDGQLLTQLVIEIGQRRRGYFDHERQRRADAGLDPLLPADFMFRGGCTMLIDLGTGRLRYLVTKSIRDEARLERQRYFLAGTDRAVLSMASGDGIADEPFADLLRAY